MGRKENPGALGSATGAGLVQTGVVNEYPERRCEASPSVYFPPPGAYVSVRLMPDGWAAVVAQSAVVLAMTPTYSDRSEAFRQAIKKAESAGLPCLVRRAAG